MGEPARRVRIIGIGSGHPDQLTREAVEALGSVDYVIAVAKSDDDPLLGIRRALCDRYAVPLVVVPDPERDRSAGSISSAALVPGPANVAGGTDEHTADPTRDIRRSRYEGAVRDWHQARVDAFEQVLVERPGDVGFLVWGDPAFYDSTIRIVESLARRVPLECDVLPGISSPQLLAARHRMVLHQVGQPILVTTGRRLAEAVAAGHDNIVVMLDGSLTCLDLDLPDWRIWWGANLGAADEQLVAGPLVEVADELRRRRDAVKDASGWVLDTYLLRRV
ncbi:precorrin-6A synthase (deacetylating) [Nocardioides marmoriginsengisoli]|uniref:Precorrin-6A synthase (Deacetylating) n=1 Tax=Nocardioides marmoriginsengisoli TaxID=661483 RepID=A0A3N0CBG7_9ACTN|nr:precorrin-6A synthase (deacetylating) [Nocardioides marmoriginsengisoli]RNL60784.1 precorrin-6A synthase (deacetylating) [Nocardioides marmoriginsengisoli]